MPEHGYEQDELSLSPDSQEVAYFIAGYVAKKLSKRFKYELCSKCMIGQIDNEIKNNYLNSLSRGGLTIPSSQIAEYVCACFAILDYANRFIERHGQSTTREAAETIFKIYSPKFAFTCEQNIYMQGKLL